MRLRTLGDKLTEIKAEAMVDTLGERLGHLEIETLALDSYCGRNAKRQGG